MTEDETPLHQIIWQRFLKAMGTPPPVSEAEQSWWQEVWMNRITIIRASLITSAAAYLVNARWFTPSAMLGAVQGLLPSYSNFASGYKVAGLLLLALMSPLILSWGTRCWRYCFRHSFIPLFAIALMLGWAWTAHHPECPSFVQWGVAILLLVSAAALGWQSQQPETVIVDHLQRGYFVERLFELFQVPNATMKRIAVLGTWGSGKTTVLHLLRQRLRQSKSPEFGVALVNPWVAKSPEDMQRMLAEAFDEALGQPDYFASPWSRLPWLSWLTGFKAAAGFGLNFDLKQVFEGGSSLQEQKLMQRINRDLRSLKKTCVILVDDMERADPEIIRKMFPVINVLRDIESCFFVFAIDPDRVAKAFEEDGQSSDETKGYLDKVFDLKQQLPIPRPKDIAIMCEKMVNRSETPKLANCLPACTEYLPCSPREAISFLSEAKTKERLFLTRYGDVEHPFRDLFLFLLLEAAIPNANHVFKGPKVEAYQQSLASIKAPVAGPSSEDLFEDTWKDLIKSRQLTPYDEKRIKKLFKHLISAKLDVYWAHSDHMRLLKPSRTETAEIRSAWVAKAGIESLRVMLQCLAGRSFADLEDAAEQFVNDELQRYDDLRRQIALGRLGGNQGNVKEATEIIVRVLKHFRYASRSGANFDLNVFDKHFWTKVFEIVCEKEVDTKFPRVGRMVKIEQALLLDLVDNLPFDYCFSYGFQSVQELASHHIEPHRSIAHIEAFLQNLRDKLGERIRILFFKQLAEAANDPEWNMGALGFEQFKMLLFNPSRWIQVIDSKRQENLVQLTQLGGATKATSKAFKRVIKSLMLLLKRAAEQDEVQDRGEDEPCDPNENLELVLESKDFIRAVVCAATAYKSDLSEMGTLNDARSEMLSANEFYGSDLVEELEDIFSW